MGLCSSWVCPGSRKSFSWLLIALGAAVLGAGWNVGSVLLGLPQQHREKWGSHRVTHSEITKELPC